MKLKINLELSLPRILLKCCVVKERDSLLSIAKEKRKMRSLIGLRLYIMEETLRDNQNKTQIKIIITIIIGIMIIGITIIGTIIMIEIIIKEIITEIMIITITIEIIITIIIKTDIKTIEEEELDTRKQRIHKSLHKIIGIKETKEDRVMIEFKDQKENQDNRDSREENLDNRDSKNSTDSRDKKDKEGIREEIMIKDKKKMMDYQDNQADQKYLDKVTRIHG